MILALIMSVWGAIAFGAVPAHANIIHVIKVDGVINNGTGRYIARGIETAEAQGAKLLIVTLNTPGGLLNVTRDIVQRIGVSRVPVAVYVTPSGASATSAGTIITMAAHFAAMAPGTNIGAAHPVGGQGEDIKGSMGEKAVNDTVGFIKAQAVLRHRNAQWAEDAIRKSVSATADEAAQLKVVDFVASDLDDLIYKIDHKAPTLGLVGTPRTQLEMTTAEKFLAFIGDPNVSYLLMAAGGLGIYAELSAPGISFPGIMGAICLILGFISLSTLPVNYGAVALLVLGLVLFMLELFITSYGLLTVGGIVSLVLGALLLMDQSTGDLRLSMTLVIPTIAAVAVITSTIGYIMYRSRKHRYDGLDSFKAFDTEVDTVNADGFTGKCLVRGEIWDFELIDKTTAARKGDRLEVIDRNGLRLKAKLKGR